MITQEQKDRFLFQQTKAGQETIQALEYMKRQYAHLDVDDTTRLVIRFEDLILDYDNTCKNIEKYLNLGEHKCPQSCLDTSISCKNIGTWKETPEIPQEDVDKIYDELREYCYEY